MIGESVPFGAAVEVEPLRNDAKIPHPTTEPRLCSAKKQHSPEPACVLSNASVLLMLLQSKQLAPERPGTVLLVLSMLLRGPFETIVSACIEM